MIKRRKMLFPSAVTAFLVSAAFAQDNATPNGVNDERAGAYAFTNANIYQDDGSFISGGTLLIRDGRIVDVNENGIAPDGFFEVNLSGRYIYPGLIDIYSDYGIPELEREDNNGSAENLYPSEQAFNVNDAIRSNFRASTAFTPDEEDRAKFRDLGFSSVLSLRPDGIARGTSALITLGDKNANEAIVVPDAAAHFSLSKGTSSQSMPSSLMGAFALLRQTYLDVDWFTGQQPRPFTDDTLEAWSRNQSLPQVMEVGNWQEALTVDRLGDEFATQYVLKTSGDSYRHVDLVKATGATLIVPINFPEAPDVEDTLTADDVSLEDLKHWELAPFNARILAEQEIPFSITSSGADDDFWENLRTAVKNGLPQQVAIDALTRIPAATLGVSDLVGQLTPSALANFIITSDQLLKDGSLILENWIQGERYVLNQDYDNREGNYALEIGSQTFQLELSFNEGKAAAKLLLDGESRTVNLDLSEDLISLSFVTGDDGNRTRLSGWPESGGWSGNGRTPDGALVDWQLVRSGNLEDDPASDDNAEIAELPTTVTYPFAAYGRQALPLQQDMLIRGATVWTNEDDGVVITDVLVRDGQIAEVGENLSANGVTIVDGAGKHLTPGIIDEHSHIALFNINEGQTNSSMVRMKEVVDSENINIYRNLAGGVVAAQLLHGSANPIGGQSAIIKMRWGSPSQELLIEGADEYIKFALGENVKRSRSPTSIRYPQTRMGVEQVFVNAFSQAQEYGRTWDEYNNLSRNRQRSTIAPRRDLVKETMLEILNGERYVTSHSYVQSEINMLMNVADSFDFNINTFTHILEGYKVADKMAQHGAGGSTFADWWGYKWEVRYAIPYNAALMQQAGVVVALNSDDAEMSRRLNQEAAKAVKYGNVSEIDALKMVTLNPAILLHLDDRMGSIRAGKDADLVLWSDHPLSVYAVAETTWIEGVPYYDREEDSLLRQQIGRERARIITSITRDTSASNEGQDDDDVASQQEKQR
ncbi:MAG: amidohydrolase family protein [Gammaproteobacteria bacterium]|nr:amidohydrolase family protein [Gammaproteobacteria bacterium]MBT3858441.1 amidohydrolase family protein [Gammaproteobacteria bacterium]MBT3986821.1 amidohydrolase family protein [Gammaproteobacteria bacterium]MBT4581201.1 amidohydrolase family protein [Gammaproteobacteria bacterium]MBT4657640.1 amidohydrolase family protein [Gammaproteobacteria bacterium]